MRLRYCFKMIFTYLFVLLVCSCSDKDSSKNLQISNNKPDSFSFIDITNADPFTFVNSDIVPISGLSAPAPIELTGAEGTPWSLAEVNPFDKNKFSYRGQMNSSSAVSFSADGSQMYLIDGTGKVHQYPLSSAWDASSAINRDWVFDLSNEETVPSALSFSSDGTKMYVFGTTNDQIFQYSLATAWKVDTASYDNITSMVLTNEDATPNKTHFSQDGTHLYILGTTTNTVYQYTLIAPWDISNIVYSGNSFSVGSEESSPSDILLSSDGSKLYVIGTSSDSLYSYTMSPSWDIGSAVYDDLVFNVSRQDHTPMDIAIAADGKKFYIIGTSRDTVHQFSAMTAWEIASLSVSPNSMNTIGSQPSSVRIHPNGSRIYYIDRNQAKLYQQDLVVPWDVSITRSIESSLSLSGEDTQPQSITFNNDGSKMYILGDTTNSVLQYTLSTPWDILTATYDTVAYSVSEDTVILSFWISPSGSNMYIYGENTNSIYQYSLGTPWDMGSVSYMGTSLDMTISGTQPAAISLTDNGSQLFIIDSTSSAIHEFSLSSAWDISSASYKSKSISLSNLNINPVSLCFSSGGEDIYILNYGGYSIYQFPLNEGYNVETLESNETMFDFSNQDTVLSSVRFSADGSKLYSLGGETNSVYQYNLTKPWQVKSATYSGVGLIVSQQDFLPRSIRFNNVGSKMYLVGQNGGGIYQYSLGTNWDLSTANYDNIFLDISSIEVLPQSIVFSNDGEKMYILGRSQNRIYQYSLSSPWEVDTALYDGVFAELAPEVLNVIDFNINLDGDKVVVLGDYTLFNFNLDFKWNISSLTSSNETLYIGLPIAGTLTSFFFGQNGTQLYISRDTTNRVDQFKVGKGLPAEYRVCLDKNCESVRLDWSSESDRLIYNQEYLQLRQRSPGSSTASSQITISISGRNSTWTVKVAL